MTTRLSAMTKRQLIILDLWCESFDKDALVTIPDDAQITRRKDGEIMRIVETNRNALGAVTNGSVATWSYFSSGSVDTIIMYQTDASSNEIAGTRKTIKHGASGGQPVAT